MMPHSLRSSSEGPPPAVALARAAVAAPRQRVTMDFAHKIVFGQGRGMAVQPHQTRSSGSV